MRRACCLFLMVALLGSPQAHADTLVDENGYLSKVKDQGMTAPSDNAILNVGFWICMDISKGDSWNGATQAVIAANPALDPELAPYLVEDAVDFLCPQVDKRPGKMRYAV